MSDHSPQPEVTPMDVSEYRRQVEAELEQTTQQPAVRDLLDRAEAAASPEAEVAAGAGPPDGEDLEAAVAVLGEAAADPQRQSEALTLISLNIEAWPDLIDRLLELLGDASVPMELRGAILDKLQEISFRLPLFPAKRPAYLATLRSIIEVPDARLRRRVVGILAREKDEYVQRRLVDGLEHPSRALVPAAKAIQFLGYDIHAEHFPLVRRILERPPSRPAKREAVRLLAADPGSVELLVGVLRDKRESSEIRRVAATAVQALSPDQFEAEARRIVLDEEEDDQLRAVCISALALFTEPGAYREDEELTRRIEALRTGSRSRLLRQATAAYLARHGG
jgi:hypothetical protein